MCSDQYANEKRRYSGEHIDHESLHAGSARDCLWRQETVQHGLVDRSTRLSGTDANGKRHGILETWDEAGQPVLFAQYANGKHHGFSCYFADGEFRLLCEYKNDQLQYAQLMSGLSPDDGFRSRGHSYVEVARAARALAARLHELGLRKGDKVVFWSENRPEWIVAFWACLLRGIIVVPIDYRASPDFLARVVRIVSARLILIGQDVPPFAAPDGVRSEERRVGKEC